MHGYSHDAEVYAKILGGEAEQARLLVLDSTDPDQIKNLENAIDIKRTQFIVSSKSGTTLEPNILKDYFLVRVKQEIGEEEAGSHFIAITDPASPLGVAAEKEHFLRICLGRPSIGGRYSVLSDFGLVPAAI